MKELPNIPRPCKEQVDLYVKDTTNSDLAKAQKKIFLEFPENKKIEDILIKVAAVNQFDSANVMSIQKVSNHIKNITNMDERLGKEDLSLVDNIANIENLKPRLYSFATKYFSHHFDGKYPIYDQYVSKILRHFNNEHKFMSKFSDQHLKDYEFLNKCINSFINHFELNNYSKKDIDKYLWLIGKKHYNQYKQKNN